MKLLICSYAYWPSVGGMETTAREIALRAKQCGHDVVVLTATDSDVELDDDIKVIRNPGPVKHVRLFLWADVVISKHLASRLAWPLMLVRKPFTIWYASHERGRGKIARVLLKALERRALQVANSQFVRDQIPGCRQVVYPGYDDHVFRNSTDQDGRSLEFAYVGRLEVIKGVDTLLKAIMAFPDARLTIVGSGTAETELKLLAAECGVLAQVNFAGAKLPSEINLILNRHRVLVVPSRYEEPFGKVALEGLACGCRVVVSDTGGLHEAGGPSAIAFPAEDVSALVTAMEEALRLSLHADAEAATHLKNCTVGVGFEKLAGLSGLLDAPTPRSKEVAT